MKSGQKDAEDFAGDIRTIKIFGIEDMTKFVTGKAINTYLFKPAPKAIYILRIENTAKFLVPRLIQE